MISICEASMEDVVSIQNIAFETWPVVYGNIITQSQIKYMLDLFYSEAVLTDSIISKVQDFLLLKDQGKAIGFASFEHNYLQQKVTRLHKLYLLPQSQGKGQGKVLINAVVEKAKENSSLNISLNVNKFNPALTFYKKVGFEIVGEEKLPIGNNFFMDDYKMELKIQ